MIKLLLPFVSITEGNGRIQPMTPQPINSINSTVGTALDLVKMGGYAVTFILFIVSIVFLIMFIVSKVNGSEKAKRNLIIFIVLISVTVFIGLGVIGLDMVWNAMTSI